MTNTKKQASKPKEDPKTLKYIVAILAAIGTAVGLFMAGFIYARNVGSIESRYNDACKDIEKYKDQQKLRDKEIDDLKKQIEIKDKDNEKVKKQLEQSVQENKKTQNKLNQKQL